MISRPLPAAQRELSTLALRVHECTACPLYLAASQAVVGEGSPTARIVVVGEQPGDQEDLLGRPFVGPAGRILDEAIAESGLVRDDLYITNAVKHFKWEARGSRRLHKKPSRAEISTCMRWLEAELAVIQPAVVVALGATAGATFAGPSYRVGSHRGLPLAVSMGAWSGQVIGTVHPSAVLRAPTPAARSALHALLVADLGEANLLATKDPEGRSLAS